MNLHLATHHGMCFGVRDALRATHAAAAARPVTMLGQLVHNPLVDAHLGTLGVQKGDLEDTSSATTRDLSWFDNKTLGCFPGTPRENFSDSSGKVTWATANNQFFFVALMPTRPVMIAIIPVTTRHPRMPKIKLVTAAALVRWNGIIPGLA